MIGVVLIVAITVILAATVGAFATGLFDRKTNPGPSVAFEYAYDQGVSELTITHGSGSKFERTNVDFVRESVSDPTVSKQWPSKVTSGDQTVLDGVDTDDRIRIVWEDPREDDLTAVIGTWEGSEA